MGLLVLAQWFVESVQTVTKDVDFLKFAAHIHELNESWQKAINCWEQVKKFQPQRPGRQPPDQRPFGGGNDQARRP